MDDISIVARQKAKREETVGGTCLGDKRVPICGPKCRLRQRHNAEAASSAAKARRLSDRAIGVIARLQADQSRQGMVETFMEAKALASHSELTAISAWLTAERAGFRSRFYDEKSGQHFICRDPDLEAKLAKALGLVTSGFDLPAAPLQPVSVDIKDAIAKSYTDGIELALSWIGDADPSQREALAFSIPGFLVAGGVELVIIVLLIFGALVRRDKGLDWGPEDDFILHARSLPPRHQREYRRLADLIFGLILEDRGRWYFARPIDGDTAIARRCFEAAIILELPLERRFKSEVPLSDIYPEWVGSRAEVHGGARWFALHQLTKGMREWLRKAARDLRDQSDDDLPEPPPYLKVVSGK